MSDILQPRTTHSSGAKLPRGWYWDPDCPAAGGGVVDYLRDDDDCAAAVVWYTPGEGWRWKLAGIPAQAKQRPSSLGGARRKAADAAIARSKHV